MTLGRVAVVDFTQAFFVEPTAILISAPMKDTRLFAFIKPFQLEVATTRLYYWNFGYLLYEITLK